MPDQSSVPTKKPPERETIDLAGFVSSVPPPLTTTLVRLSPWIGWIRRAIEIVSWKTSWEESWLLIAAWWALCLLVGIGKQYVSGFFSGRVLTFLARIHQARHSRASRRSTRLAKMEITSLFTTTPSHRKPYSPHRLGPYQDSGVSTFPSTCLAPTPPRPTARHRCSLHSVFDTRFCCPPTSHFCRHRNCCSDMEGAVGCCRSEKPVG